jgi:hypothetical protein
LAVLVPDRLAKPQKPKRKKLALVATELFQGISNTGVESKKISSSTLKQFFFFNGFCSSANRAPVRPSFGSRSLVFQETLPGFVSKFKPCKIVEILYFTLENQSFTHFTEC